MLNDELLLNYSKTWDSLTLDFEFIGSCCDKSATIVLLIMFLSFYAARGLVPAEDVRTPAGSQQGPGPPSVCGVKTRRKQARPTRSADVADPDFQGVMFRMEGQLDCSRRECRLLITSKYR